jgi:cell division transport system permease protein
MLSRLLYVLRETGSSLARNVTLTAAALLTVVVSLMLVGLALITRQGVNNSLSQWGEGVEFIVFMNPDAPQDQIDAIGRDLDENPQVESTVYLNKEQAFAEFSRLYQDEPLLVESLGGPAGAPPNYKVVPTTTDEQVVISLADQYRRKPGVESVSAAPEAIKTWRILTTFLTVGLFVVAIVLLLAAIMLIWNTIRTAMYARRREIEIMKLVGATNWFVRVPFMLEGLVQGLVGAIVACFGVLGVNALWHSQVLEAPEFDGENLIQAARLTGGELTWTLLLLLITGAVVGTIGSGIAVSRFLDV